LIIYTPDDNEKRTGFFLTQDGKYDGAWKGFDKDVIHYETMWGTVVTDSLRDKYTSK
jgi:hypothetical protein